MDIILFFFKDSIVMTTAAAFALNRFRSELLSFFLLFFNFLSYASKPDVNGFQKSSSRHFKKDKKLKSEMNRKVKCTPYNHYGYFEIK